MHWGCTGLDWTCAQAGRTFAENAQQEVNTGGLCSCLGSVKFSMRMWFCPSGETHPCCPVSELTATKMLALCHTARITDLIWKEALVDDLVLPAARWLKYVFLLTYTGAFNLLFYWALFDFTYHYHNDMLVESRANHGLCTVPTTNIIRLN